MPVKVSVILPYVRPDRVRTTVKYLEENAGIEDWELIEKYDRDRIGCPKMVHKLVNQSDGDLICFIGDDTRPVYPFLRNALEAMATLPDGWGLVGLDDLTGRTLPTHWLADRRLLPLLGGEFFHTGYTHCCCDVELMERCIDLGRYVYARSALVLHDHPILSRDYRLIDADYSRVYSRAVWYADEALLAKRRKEGWP